ncbi:MAG: PAS domain-containing protein [Duncaniella sp.]|uniref:sensor histidine kinase n=1 Tax=Duncaniella sp. TaxID=2518496 RepID=UPI0023D22D78|nr:ATP-binding protein [Duncaniella sp.]MDE5988547.1 PAS domain-containing protein [Duncaniella sp.]
MRISWILIIIILLLGASIVSSLLLSATDGNSAMYVTQSASVLAFILLIVFYRNVMKPIRSISNGIDLLREQDFSSRLSHVNQHEADRIVDMFNGMMVALKEERLRLREQNHFLDLLVDVSPMGILILTDNDEIKTANKAAASFLEVSDSVQLQGRTLGSLDSRLAAILAGLQQGETVTERLNDSMIYRCSRLSFMDQGFPHPFVLIEKLTEEVMKAEKKSYEKVIRVIAHEVNNSMAGVNSMLSTARLMLGESGEDYADLNEVVSVCEARCKSMSKFITSFADVVKIPEASLKKADLNSLLESWRVMLESLCVQRNITLCYRLSGEPLEVMVDPVLMEQVLINIVKNSAESIGSDGQITVSTTGSPATLAVTDNGPGIDPEAAKMLFSPFFSTKVNGHGIGLLFISEVLHKHGCRFSLATGADSLTRFTIHFKTAGIHRQQ